MRVLIATFGSLGDLHPYLAIARTLVSRGHAVTLATHPSYRERVEGAGLAFRPMRPDVTEFEDGWMRRANDTRTGSEFVLRRMLLPRLAASAADLRPLVPDADVVVSHALTFAAPALAEQAGIPWVGTALQPAVLFSSLDPPTMSGTGALRRIRAFGPGAYARAFGLVRLWSRPWMRPVDRMRAELGLPKAAGHPLFEGLFSPHLNLALFSARLAPPQPDWPAPMAVTGFPFFSTPGAVLDPVLARFLDLGPPPIVFTLGSSAVADPGDFYASGAAAAARLGRRAVLLAGEGAAARFAGRLGRDAIAVDQAPHALVFPRAAAVVIHGGIGTTAEALRAGTPIVFVPFSHDQPDNAERVGRLGISRTVPRAAGPARLAGAIGALLLDPAVRPRAEAVAREIRAEDGATRAAEAIEGLGAGALSRRRV